MLHQREHPVADRVPRGLVARDHQDAEVVVELLLVQDALGLRDRERVDHVVLRVGEAKIALAVGVVEHLVGRGGAEGEQAVGLGVLAVDDRAGEVRVLVRDHLVAPRDQLRRVLLRHGEDRAEEPDRQVAADLGHEVELALGERAVQDVAGDVADPVLVLADPAGREALRADRAELRVPGRVGLEHRLPDLELLVVELLQGDGAELRRVGPPVHVDRGQVVVAGDRPEAGVRRPLRMPEDRVLGAQVIEPARRGRPRRTSPGSRGRSRDVPRPSGASYGPLDHPPAAEQDAARGRPGKDPPCSPPNRTCSSSGSSTSWAACSGWGRRSCSRCSWHGRRRPSHPPPVRCCISWSSSRRSRR